MGYDVVIKDLPALRFAAVRATTSMDKIGEALSSGWGQVFAALSAAGAPPSGPPFAIYHQYGGETGEVEFEACVPTAADNAVSTPIVVRDEPPTAAAVTLHKGPYDQLGGAYEALQAWMGTQGRQITGPPREIYLTDPSQVTDPEEFLTEIQWPVV